MFLLAPRQTIFYISATTFHPSSVVTVRQTISGGRSRSIVEILATNVDDSLTGC